MVNIRDISRHIILIYNPYFILLSKPARIIGKSASKHALKYATGKIVFSLQP